MNTRTKHRNFTTQAITPAQWKSDIPLENGSYSRTLECPVHQVTEAITDERKFKRSYNFCTHEQGRLASNATMTTPHMVDTSGNEWSYVDVGSQAWHLSGNPSLKVGKRLAGVESGEPNEDDIAYYLQRCIKGPPEVLSLPNFLWELREFKTLFRLWKPKLGFLVQIAHLRLGYQYGWKLFIQDCISILKSLNTLSKRLKKYLDNMGRVKLGRYRVRLSDQDTGLDADNSVGSYERYGNTHDPGFPQFRIYYDHSYKLTKHWEVGNVRYSCWIPELSALQAQSRALLNAFGIEWNARIIWDAIPYSFVLDWFFQVSDWLDDWAKIPTLPIHTRIHDCSIARMVQVESVTQFRWQKGWDELHAPVYHYHLVKSKAKVYTRWVDLHPKPSQTALTNAGFSALKGSRLLNGASLLVVNTRVPVKPPPRRKRPPKPRRFNPMLRDRNAAREPKTNYVRTRKPFNFVHMSEKNMKGAYKVFLRYERNKHLNWVHTRRRPERLDPTRRKWLYE